LELGNASALTRRTNGYELLRWVRVLWATEFGREQATGRRRNLNGAALGRTAARRHG
jgi:hypothetical protein